MTVLAANELGYFIEMRTPVAQAARPAMDAAIRGGFRGPFISGGAR